VITHQGNQAFYEASWAAPRTLSPDKPSGPGKAPSFQTFTEKKILTDGRRTIEVRTIANSPHAEGFAMVYLPSERLLIEADAYTPANGPVAPGRGGPGVGGPSISPSARNLYDNILRLKLDVTQIVAASRPGPGEDE
jgi:hypothetical protein